MTPPALTALLGRRTVRERWLMLGAAAAVTVWAGVAGLWQPLVARNAGLADRIARQEAALARIGRLVAPTPSPDPRPGQVILQDAAEAYGLTITRLQPDGAAVQAVLADAPFDAVLLWIEALEQDHGLRLATLSLTRRPAPGTVATELTAEDPAHGE